MMGEKSKEILALALIPISTIGGAGGAAVSFKEMNSVADECARYGARPALREARDCDGRETKWALGAIGSIAFFSYGNVAGLMMFRGPRRGEDGNGNENPGSAAQTESTGS